MQQKNNQGALGKVTFKPIELNEKPVKFKLDTHVSNSVL